MIQKGDQVTIVHKNVVLICRVISTRPANNRMPEGAEEIATVITSSPSSPSSPSTHSKPMGVVLEAIREVSRSGGGGR